MTWTVAGTSSGVSYAPTAVTTVINSTSNATYVFSMDLSEMSNGAMNRIHLNTTATSVTTVPVQIWCGTYQHKQLNPIKMSPFVSSPGIIFNVTFETVTGTTTGTFPWQLLSQ